MCNPPVKKLELMVTENTCISVKKCYSVGAVTSVIGTIPVASPGTMVTVRPGMVGVPMLGGATAVVDTMASSVTGDPVSGVTVAMGRRLVVAIVAPGRSIVVGVLCTKVVKISESHVDIVEGPDRYKGSLSLTSVDSMYKKKIKVSKTSWKPTYKGRSSVRSDEKNDKSHSMVEDHCVV